MLTFLSVIFVILIMAAIFLFLLGVMNSAWEPMTISLPLGAIAAVIVYIYYILQ